MNRQPKILWSERDIGQKFSILMMGLCFVVLTGFWAYDGLLAAIAGNWFQLIAPAGFVVAVVSLCLAWRQRNAR